MARTVGLLAVLQEALWEDPGLPAFMCSYLLKSTPLDSEHLRAGTELQTLYPEAQEGGVLRVLWLLGLSPKEKGPESPEWVVSAGRRLEALSPAPAIRSLPRPHCCLLGALPNRYSRGA